MYWIAVLVAGGFLALLCLSCKEEAIGDTAFLFRPFCKIAMYLYKKISTRFHGLFASSQVEKDLLWLYPGESAEYLKTEYYVRKIALCLAIFVVGTLFGTAAEFSIRESIILGEDGVVARGDYREGVREINLRTDYGQNEMAFWVQVEPRQLSEGEIEELFDTFLGKLPEYILGENESLQNVTSDLRLEENYEGYPIAVEWESDKSHILGNDGHLSSVGHTETVLLSVRLHYGGYDRQSEVAVTVQPPRFTEDEMFYMEMDELLRQSQKESLEQEGWELPSKWRGESILWRQATKDNSLLLWMTAIAAAVLAYLFKDKDLHGQLERRKKALRWEYSEILHKLALFVGAGMTVRGAFQKIAADYEAKLGCGGMQSPACEEMLYTCRELLSGISEGKAYERFGRRTGLQEYIRLSTLLMQNLKRGNAALLERLHEEADKAAEEQLQQCRKLGEEAGTKLLVPMTLMLAVVMTVVMIPAFSAM